MTDRLTPPSDTIVTTVSRGSTNNADAASRVITDRYFINLRSSIQVSM